MSTDDVRSQLATNRANWDSRALVHEDSPFYDIQRYVEDRNSISDTVELDRRVLGDVDGLDVLHLQCHIGTDTISWARLGAQVVGLDFSPESLRVAKGLAAATNQPVRFVCADVRTADRVLRRDFDIVYASVGVLCWIPDIDGWVRAAAGCLRPGGRLYLRDGHPLMSAFDWERTDEVVLSGDYFGDGTPELDDAGYTYTGDDRRLDPPINYQWSHGLGRMVTSMVDHGLRIERLDEMDWQAWKALPWMVQDDEGRWRFPDDRPRIPLMFSVLATRPAPT